MEKFTFWNHPWALSLTSAVLLSLSFPPFDLAVLQIPAFVFLFRLTLLSSGIRQLILYAYPSFVLWNLIVTYWLMMATPGGGMAAILANALIMIIPLILIRMLFISKMNPIPASLIAASVWVSYEYLHHTWDLAWPWLTLGNGWSNLTGAIQFISVTGYLGISFWVVCTAALLYRFLEEPVKPILYSGIVIFFSFPVFSVLAAVTAQQPEGESIEVAVIQPNSDSYQQYGGLASLDELTGKLLALSGGVVTENTDLILWPENALDSTLPYHNQYFNRIRDSLTVWNSELITGTGFIEYFDEDKRPAVVRETLSGRLYNVFNAAFHISPEQQNDVYRKGKLVPVVERFPFVEFFQKADLFDRVDWGSRMGYGLGRDANNFQIGTHRTPALICYDSVFPGWVNRFVDDGADFLTIITNDGWWGDSNGHIQHFAYARLRAIEQRRWIARSANNGISGIISPDGKVQVKTEYWTEDAFTFTIYSNERKTFYARHGEWFGQLMLVISGGGFFVFGLISKYGKNWFSISD
jgi:apolipoprotein N-acyltransferase